MINIRKIILLAALLTITGCAGVAPEPDYSALSRLPHHITEKWRTVALRGDVSDQPIFTSIEDVNSYVNKFHYISDQKNYGVADHWATPREFFAHKGGDCEDFVVAKYFLILKSGLAKKSDMEIVLAFDFKYNMPHALLIINGRVLNSYDDHIYNLGDRHIGQFSYIGIVNKEDSK